MNATSLLLAMVLAGQVPLSRPAETSTPEKGAEIEAIEGFKKGAAAYDIRLADGANSRVALAPQPLLHWNNPARTSEDGAVFIWLQAGRPEVIGSIFTYKLAEVRTKHEFQSLATVPLSARYGETLAWQAPAAGVTFRPIPGSPVPAESARLRTIQLKNLAREFSASLINERDEATPLRLLPQPLYRYDSEAKAVLDGAIFSFALGTDPEAILLLEARKEAGAGDGSWRWEYAFARFHFDGVAASHRDKEVYRAQRDGSQLSTRLGDPASRDKIYVTFHVE